MYCLHIVRVEKATLTTKWKCNLSTIFYSSKLQRSLFSAAPLLSFFLLHSLFIASDFLSLSLPPFTSFVLIDAKAYFDLNETINKLKRIIWIVLYQRIVCRTKEIRYRLAAWVIFCAHKFVRTHKPWLVQQQNSTIHKDPMRSMQHHKYSSVTVFRSTSYIQICYNLFCAVLENSKRSI